MLKLQTLFSDPEELLLPLILQNKVTIAEDLLKGQPDMQRTLISYLDNLLAPDTNLQIVLDEYIRYVLKIMSLICDLEFI